MYKVKEDLISEQEFEAAIKVVRESDLKVRHTPLILVSRDTEKGTGYVYGTRLLIAEIKIFMKHY